MAKKILNSSIHENQSSFSKKKVLIIEDEKILMEMYSERLKEAGFEVVGVTEAKHGLEAVKKEKPDLVLLDILLPRENGIYFLEKLRKDPKIGTIPVLVFSNYDDAETKKKSAKLGIEGYLIKTDYTPNQIVDKIKNYLK